MFYTCDGDVAAYLGAKDWMVVNNKLVRMWMEGFVA